MVFDSIDLQRDPAESANSTAKVCVKSVFEIGQDQRQTALRSVNDVVEKICICHGSSLSPVNGLGVCCQLTPRLRVELNSVVRKRTFEESFLRHAYAWSLTL